MYSIAFSRNTKCYNELMICGNVILGYFCFEFLMYSMILIVLMKMTKAASNMEYGRIIDYVKYMKKLGFLLLVGALYVYYTNYHYYRFGFGWWIYTLVKLSSKDDDCKKSTSIYIYIYIII